MVAPLQPRATVIEQFPIIQWSCNALSGYDCFPQIVSRTNAARCYSLNAAQPLSMGSSESKSDFNSLSCHELATSSASRTCLHCARCLGHHSHCHCATLSVLPCIKEQQFSRLRKLCERNSGDDDDDSVGNTEWRLN